MLAVALYSIAAAVLLLGCAKSTSKQKSTTTQRSDNSSNSQAAGRNLASISEQKPADFGDSGVEKDFEEKKSVKVEFVQEDETQKTVPVNKEEYNGDLRPPLILSKNVCNWTEAGGQQTISLTNNSTTHIALKIKCSDNKLFIITPVFHRLSPGKSFNVVITRSPGALKLDKVVVCWSPCDPFESKDLVTFFKKPNLEVTMWDIIQEWESNSLVPI